MRNMLSCALGAWLLLGAPAAARCEEGENVAFVSAGLGAGSEGMATVASVNIRHGRWLYMIRMSRTEEFAIFGPSPSQSNTDVGFLMGKAACRGSSVSSAAVGLAVVDVVRRGAQISAPGWFDGGRYERRETITLGVPVDVKTTLNVKNAGVGINIFANLNTRGSFGGLALTVQLGRMR